MFGKFRTITNQQKGFIFIEMIVVIALAGLVLSAAAVSISQLLIIHAQNTAHMQVVKQVESAIHWVSRDMMMAQTVKTDDLDPGAIITFTWAEWDNPGDPVQVTYILNNGELRRIHSVNGEIVVAQYVESATVTPKPYTGGKLSFTITAALNGLRSASETRSIEVIPRPGL
jgi:type II secretory pathway pseudopilin PulG